MNTEGKDCGLDSANLTYTLADRWIRSRLQLTIRETANAIENYRFDLAAQAIYEFVWNEYCDWYLELSKPTLYGAGSSDNPESEYVLGTRQTLVQILETVLRLTHPFMPFITEEIWQRVAPPAGKQGVSIMLQAYPEVDESWIDPESTAEMEWVMNIILGVRRIRGEMNIAPGKPLPILIQNGSEQDRIWLNRNQGSIVKLARVETVTWLSETDTAPESATALVGEMKVLIPMKGLIDKDAELARLDKEIQRLSKDLPRIEGKLNDSAFLAKAPPQVVAKEQTRLQEIRLSLAELQAQAEKIRAL
jgi:valyl-tRNA synthetase